jgi:hypothetical protein
MAWMKEQNIQKVTKDYVRKAKRKGISKSTLCRALEKLRLEEKRRGIHPNTLSL